MKNVPLTFKYILQSSLLFFFHCYPKNLYKHFCILCFVCVSYVSTPRTNAMEEHGKLHEISGGVCVVFLHLNLN